MKNIFHFLASKQLTLTLFIGLVLLLVPTTFLENPLPALTILVRFLLLLLANNILFCTFQRLRQLKKSTLIIHVGTLIIMAGSLTSSFLGSIATINIHEGNSSDSAYRWDQGQDLPLGFTLHIQKIHTEYYPIAIKIGALRDNKKVKLFELNTGDVFELGSFQILADTVDPANENLRCSIYKETEKIGTYNTKEQPETLPGFPYTLQLVAYKTPVIKKVWVDLTLQNGDTVLAEGSSAVNAPFIWKGLRFFHTENGIDLYGLPYAGIQIVRDPGVLYVYIGFWIVCAGLFLTLLQSSFFARKRNKCEEKLYKTL